MPGAVPDCSPSTTTPPSATARPVETTPAWLVPLRNGGTRSVPGRGPRDADRRRARSRRYGQRYDEQILPTLTDSDVAADALGQTLRNGTRGYAIRVAFFIENFTKMAGGAVDADVGLLYGASSRQPL